VAKAFCPEDTVHDDATDIVRILHGVTDGLSGANRRRLVEEGRQAVSGQSRAMRDGKDGIHGNGGNVVSVTYRF
jgi:hypothetical protein